MIALLTELNQITCIAVILTFPLDIEVVEAGEREAKEEEETQEQNHTEKFRQLWPCIRCQNAGNRV